MNLEMIAKAEAFLKETFAASPYLQANPTQHAYRLEHSYRVANIARQIAQAEGFDVTYAVIAGLLHDIGYLEEMASLDERMEHGRKGAKLVRPFLQSLGLPEKAVEDICYGIAIHVDDVADFQWERTPFCETVGEADNIDRFDAYRIYESLEWLQFSQMSLDDKKKRVEATIDKLTQLRELRQSTQSAKKLWLERLDFQIAFYSKLKSQLDNSTDIT